MGPDSIICILCRKIMDVCIHISSAQLISDLFLHLFALEPYYFSRIITTNASCSDVLQPLSSILTVYFKYMISWTETWIPTGLFWKSNICDQILLVIFPDRLCIYTDTQTWRITSWADAMTRRLLLCHTHRFTSAIPVMIQDTKCPCLDVLLYHSPCNCIRAVPWSAWDVQMPGGTTSHHTRHLWAVRKPARPGALSLSPV